MPAPKEQSNLSPADLRITLGALRLSQRDAAAQLGISLSALQSYLSARCRIPAAVATRVAALLLEKGKQVMDTASYQQLELSDLAHRINSAQNALDGGAWHERSGWNKGRLFKRQDPTAASRTYPPYRVRARYSTLFYEALKHWATIIMARAKEPDLSPAHLTEYKLEAANIRALLPYVPEPVRKGDDHAFDIVITEAEWRTVSSALREYARHQHPSHETAGPAYVLYQHWRLHKGRGYPVRSPEQEAQLHSVVQKLERL